ncbi:MAG: DUF1349 domain-containing protein [Anaerolineaceae bacterium]
MPAATEKVVPSPEEIVSSGLDCGSTEFETEALDLGWKWVDPTKTSLYSLTDVPGSFRIQDNSGNKDLNSGNLDGPRLMHDVSGDFEIETKISVNPLETYQSAGLLLWIDNQNFIWIGRSVGGVIGHNFLRNGSNEGLNPPEPSYVNNLVYLKISRQKNTISTYYSDNGTDWLMTGSVEYEKINKTISAGIFVINNWQMNPFFADFDYVHISCSETSMNTTDSLPNPSNDSITMEKTVFTIAYVDETPLYDPQEHQDELIAGLRKGFIWHGFSDPNGQPALEYHTYGDKVLILKEVPPHRADNGKFDYAAVYERFDLCSKIQAGLVDEVWVWESGSGNAWEWVTNGPTWNWVNDSNVPNCGRTITSMNFNFQREIDVAYESYSHRIEGAIMTNLPCNFYTETWPWTGWPYQCSGVVSDRYGYVARPFAGNDFVAVCGDAHHPPNILDSREYVYDDPTFVNSTCEDWQMDGSGQIKNFNCEEWGCTHWGYHIWWMQNLPGIKNDDHDQEGNLMPNWWQNLF